jgi:hypothetical protein
MIREIVEDCVGPEAIKTGSVAEFMGRMGDLRGNVRVNGE